MNPSLAGPLEHIVARAMARDVAARYQTAAELAADLQRFLEGRGRPPRTSPSPRGRRGAKVSRRIRSRGLVRDRPRRARAGGDATGRFVAVGTRLWIDRAARSGDRSADRLVRPHHGPVAAAGLRGRRPHSSSRWDDGSVATVALRANSRRRTVKPTLTRRATAPRARRPSSSSRAGRRRSSTPPSSPP